MDGRKALLRKKALWGKETPLNILKSGLIETLQEHSSSRIGFEEFSKLEILLASNNDEKLTKAFEVLGQCIRRFIAGLDVSQSAAMVFFAQYFIENLAKRQMNSKDVEDDFFGKRAVSYINNNRINAYEAIYENPELAMLLEVYFLAYPIELTRYYKTLKNSDLIDRLSKSTAFNSFERIRFYFDGISLNRANLQYDLDVYDVFVKDLKKYSRSGFMRNKKITQHLVFIYLAGLYEARLGRDNLFSITLRNYANAVDVSKKLLKKFKDNAPEFYDLADDVLASYDGYRKRPSFTRKELGSNIVWLACMLDKVTYYEGYADSFKDVVHKISTAWSKKNRVSKKRKVSRSYFLLTNENHAKLNRLRRGYSTQAQVIAKRIEDLCGKKINEIKLNTEAMANVNRIPLPKSLFPKAKLGVTVDIPSSTNKQIDKLKKLLSLTRSQVVDLAMIYDEFEQEAAEVAEPIEPTEEMKSDFEFL